MGIAQTVSFVTQPYIASGQLERVLDDWCIDPMPVHVVYPQNRHLSAKVRAFVEWIAELFEATPGLRMQADDDCAGLPEGEPSSPLDEPLAAGAAAP
jgi:LysR family transcriptional regulator for bpeEF and oprC